MGSNTSKTSPETAASAQKNDSDKDNPDPRSPTPEITRTPLQNKNGGKHNITKNMDLRKTFECGKTEEKIIHNNPILLAVIKNHLQSYDPRSPTQDFDRTPIIIGSKVDIDNNTDTNLLKLKNENHQNHGSPCLKNETINSEYETSFDTNEVSPDLVVPKNLCNGFYDLTLNESLQEEDPIGSSTTSNENIENDISKEYKQATELLETNFEYLENEPDNFENDKECFVTTSNIKMEDIDVKNVPLFKILDEDPRSPSIGIDRTPIVVSKIDENIIEDNVENMSDDSLIKALQNKDPDSSLEGIPIYEDESKALNETPKKAKASSDSGSRTPLSCMKNRTETSHARSKSTNMLYDPKKEIKLPKRVSHIPRLKSLSKQPKYVPNSSSISLKNISKGVISGDCENTPPHSHRDLWDKESSIVL